MKFDKLVRDKIPEIIESTGKKVICRILSEEEYKEYLEKKLDEEVAEFHGSKSIEELVDIWEVFVHLAAAYGYESKQFFRAQKAKNKERGGFIKRICLVEVEE